MSPASTSSSLSFWPLRTCSSTKPAPTPTCFCQRPRGPKKTAPSPTPTAACSACARPYPPADSPAPIGSSSANWPSASKNAWGEPPARAGCMRILPRCWKKWAVACPNMPGCVTSALSAKACKPRCGTNTIPARRFYSPTPSPVGAASSTPWNTRPTPKCPTRNTPSTCLPGACWSTGTAAA